MAMNKAKRAKILAMGGLIFCCGCSHSPEPELVLQTETEVVIPVTFRVDPLTNQSDNEQLVKDFNGEFAGEYRMEPNWLIESTSGYRNKLKQWNVLDQLPVLITDAGFDYDFYRVLTQNDRLVDLTPWMEASDFWLDAMNPDILAGCADPDGGVFLSPLGNNIHTYAGIIYREDLLASVGYREFPQTWEEFWECLDALKQEGITPLALHGSGSYWVPMLLATAYIYGDAEGKDFLDERLPDSYQNDEMRELMEFLRRLYGYTFPDALELDYDQTAARFIDGQAALIANGRWMFETIGEKNYEKYRFAPFPGGILMNSPQMSAWAVTKGYSDEVTEGAVKVLEFRIRCAQDTKDVSDGSTLMDSYIAATEMDYRVMPNFQLQWEQEIQNEFFTEYMPGFLAGEIQTDEFLKMMDERVEEIRSKK